MKRLWLVFVASAILGGCTNQIQPAEKATAPITIAVIGTNDVHGQLVPGNERGGLTTFSGYVNALRKSGETDVVLLIDAGDMWQGTLESNLDEGASVAEAYNALGYAAATIGNHEFDFGPVGPKAIPDAPSDDPRGVLKQRASELNFPLLAANIVSRETGELPDWPNVKPSTLIRLGDVTVGVIGLLSYRGLEATIAPNVADLEMLPLADATRREAEKLREAGAHLVIVTAHAGSRCREFDDPEDLSACEPDGEIIRLARDLPRGLVDHIVAGHIHDGVAHIVNGISITASYSSTRAFGRTDFTIDASSGRLLHRKVYPPRAPCPFQYTATEDCAWSYDQRTTRTATYAGLPVVADETVAAIASQAQGRAERLKNEQLGVELAEPFTLKGNPESALGNVVLQAVLDSVEGDVALHNVTGGLRAPLPAGELTFGSVYEMFPFDNRIVIVDLTGRELREVVTEQSRRPDRRRAGIAGLRVAASCNGRDREVRMILDSGRVVRDTDTVRVIANDFLVLGGDDILTEVIPEGGFNIDPTQPLLRDVLVNWFASQDTLHPESFSTADAPTWQLDPDCTP